MNDKVDETAAQKPTGNTAGDDVTAGAELARSDTATAAGAQPDNVRTDNARPAGKPADSAHSTRNGRRERASRSWVSTLFLFCLSAAGIGAGGYFIHDLRVSNGQGRAERQLLAHRLDAQQHSHTLLAETLRQLEQRQRAADGQINELLQHFNTLRRQRGGETGWKLAEIRYLLRIASQRLALSADVDTAEAVLHSADTLLREIPDPALIPVRARLSGDINRLRAHPRADFSGMAMSLADLAARAQRLPLKTGAVKPAQESQQAEADAPPRWQQLARNVWQELKSLVVITRESGQSAALLAPPERFFLHRNLRLQLEAARLALLARDESQYRASIRACNDWLQEFFDPGATEVRSARAILQDAAALNLGRPAPSIDATLHALDEYLLGPARGMSEKATRNGGSRP